jgi:hypothetical protein
LGADSGFLNDVCVVHVAQRNDTGTSESNVEWHDPDRLREKIEKVQLNVIGIASEIKGRVVTATALGNKCSVDLWFEVACYDDPAFM